MRKRKRLSITTTKIAIALALVTTVLAMAASGSIVIAGGRNFEEGIHRIALVAMLMAYLFLIFVIMSSKHQKIEPLNIVDQVDSLAISPCCEGNVLVLDQSGIEGACKGSFAKLSAARRNAVRIVVARDVTIPDAFFEALLLFPNTTLIDLQDATVSAEFWSNLEKLPNLSHVLAINAIPIEQFRYVSISLPEVKFWMDKRRQLIFSSNVAMNSTSTEMNPIRPAKVYLIGAGPGDPGLITVRGAELIGRADAVLYDGLANEALLSYASVHAKRICVGKHGHGRIWSQTQIDDEVVRLAKMGKSVARLKGGDTAIFARTAEEVDRLVEEGVPYEIVPGITAALAASAYAGIPITHRDWSSAVALVTGRLQPADGGEDAEESLDWNALAKFPGTLVLYMGVTTAAHWSSKLIEAGKPPATPVAMVRRCTWPDQQVIRCDLGTISATIASIPGLRPPIISIVGEVIRMAKTMDWFSIRPWFGKRVWVTSPDHSAKILSKKFAEQGAEVIQQPVMAIESPTDWQTVDPLIQTLDQYDWIVFSSHYGVDGFFDRLNALGKDGRSLHRAKIAAVGSGTAAAIAKYSMVCDMVPQVSGADSLADLLIHQSAGKRFLFVRNPEGDSTAMHRLSKAGANVSSVDVYRQVSIPSMSNEWIARIESGEIDAITATSRNIASQAVALLGDLSPSQKWLSLSPSITARLNELGCTDVQTAREPSFDALVQLVPPNSAH